jgi:hypothetical protein
MDSGIMKIIDINLKCIKADEGKVLTNGEAFSSVGGEVYISINDKADNWVEITEAEYEEIMKKEGEALNETESDA